jgi:hypothetical protein
MRETSTKTTVVMLTREKLRILNQQQSKEGSYGHVFVSITDFGLNARKLHMIMHNTSWCSG